MPKGAEKFIQDIAKEAGAAAFKRLGKDGVHYAKSDRVWDVVTKADLLSEKIIISAIKKRYPDHGIISEESPRFRENAEYVWIIDPIDGTLNFSRGMPMFCVMVCLAHRDEVVLSAVSVPATRQLFFAKKGNGAFLNAKRVHCSSPKSLSSTVGAIPSGIGGRAAKFFRNLIKAGTRHHMVIGGLLSCVDECYVAAGMRDWTVSLAGSIWDFAPPYLLLKEAGCKVTDTKGRPWKLGMLEMVAANPRLHKELLKLTKNI